MILRFSITSPNGETQKVPTNLGLFEPACASLHHISHSGSHGKRSTPISQNLRILRFTLQTAICKQLAGFRSFVVACGCLALFGIVLSTISARSASNSLASATPILLTGAPSLQSVTSPEVRCHDMLMPADRRVSVSVGASGRRHSGMRSWPNQDPLFCDRRVLRSCCARRKVRRTRAEIEQERKELLNKTIREIDAIVAEFHAKLPRENAKAIGCIYARYSSRFQTSIADQVRILFEAAYERGIFIPRAHIYFDMAIRAFKDRRPGLTALRAALEAKECDVFMAFSTSRLYRRAYKAQKFAEEDLVENGVRGIFLNPLIDMKDDNWRLMFQILCSMDENAIRMSGAHVRASHEGLFIRGMVTTSLSLGFTGEDVPGEFTKHKKPRQRIVIDRDTSPWIMKMFQWYVIDGKSMDEIARELNADDEAPAPAKSLTGLWTHALVRTHLLNPCYRGFWCYGAKETKWSSKKDYAQQIRRLQPLKVDQCENLRIVSDELWFQAQELLAREKGNSGRKPKDGDRKLRPRLLRGLFVCPEHRRQLVVGGLQGRILFCPVCRAIKRETRPLFSYLRRALATRLLCERLAALVRGDEDLISETIVECQRAAESVQKSDPQAMARLRGQADRLARTIEYNRREPGDTEEEQCRTSELIKKLQNERTTALANLARIEAAENREIVVPSAEEVREMLYELAHTLISAASAETAEEMRTARRIIDELTGGRIELFQMGERRRGQGWLQARLRVDILRLATDKLAGVRPAPEGQGTEVVIDFCAPKLIDEQAEEAKKLWDQGLLNKEIAHRLHRLPSYITKLIHHWFSSRGLPVPDGRRRRKDLDRKQIATPAYKQIADDVIRLMETDLSNLAIARELKTNDVTVAKAIAWWFRSRGLPVPTAADRRLKMLQRAKHMYDADMLIKDIAVELGYTARGLKLALEKYLAELGESMRDGRARRGNAKSGTRASGQANSNGDGNSSHDKSIGPEKTS